MTEQEKTSAVVEETREAVDTTSQPVATERSRRCLPPGEKELLWWVVLQ
ncbi:hypothetical protein ACUOA5_05600, partial [Escherichia coli]